MALHSIPSSRSFCSVLADTIEASPHAQCLKAPKIRPRPSISLHTKGGADPLEFPMPFPRNLESRMRSHFDPQTNATPSVRPTPTKRFVAVRPRTTHTLSRIDRRARTWRVKSVQQSENGFRSIHLGGGVSALFEGRWAARRNAFREPTVSTKQGMVTCLPKAVGHLLQWDSPDAQVRPCNRFLILGGQRLRLRLRLPISKSLLHVSVGQS
jgi:hypothetical protein